MFYTKQILKFLHENRSEGCSTLAVDFAAHNGHTEVCFMLICCNNMLWRVIYCFFRRSRATRRYGTVWCGSGWSGVES